LVGHIDSKTRILWWVLGWNQKLEPKYLDTGMKKGAGKSALEAGFLFTNTKQKKNKRDELAVKKLL
jgi:hypothetical protein